MASPNRRVVVGLDSDKRSAVVADAHDMALAYPPTKVEIQEIWWQERVPAHVEDAGARSGPIELAAPPGGAVVRILTMPPSSDDWSLDLHFDDSMHVITVIGGQLDVILEAGEVTLQQGDSIVLPASVHDLRNTTQGPASFVYTSFPLCRM